MPLSERDYAFYQQQIGALRERVRSAENARNWGMAGIIAGVITIVGFVFRTPDLLRYSPITGIAGMAGVLVYFDRRKLIADLERQIALKLDILRHHDEAIRKNPQSH